MEKEKNTNLRFTPLHIDRRKTPRFSVHLRVEYWKTDDAKSHTGRVLDISEGGVLLNLCEQVEVGQNLSLKMFIPSTISNFIQARVRVAWRKFEKNSDYRIGATFIHIPSEEGIKLKILLNKLMNHSFPQLDF